VRTKGPLPALALEGRAAPALIEAFFELNHLKQLFRQGWLRRGISEARCESVAEHVFSMVVLGWWLVDEAFPELNRERVLRMVLVHELGEIYTGDIVPADGVAPEEKHRLEREALLRVVRKLARGAEYAALWEEFEQGQTAEARFVRQLDRLEMGFQAAVYETQSLGEMGEFYASASAALEDPRLRALFASLQQTIHPD
jgi:putative hydrolase of HD superfamily